MRTILYTTGILDSEGGYNRTPPHRWRVKTLHDSLSAAEVTARWEMDCAQQKYPADGYVIVWEQDPLEVILSSLPGHIDFNPESGGFTYVTLSYYVFHRNWWRSDGRGGRVPGAGPKTTIGFADTEQEAKAMCKEYNDTHEPGFLSRKAEYTSDF